MGVNDCQCLAAKLCRVLLAKRFARVNLGQLERHEFDDVVAIMGGTPYFSSGTEEYPGGWMTLVAERDGMAVYAQTDATDEERQAANRKRTAEILAAENAPPRADGVPF